MQNCKHLLVALTQETEPSLIHSCKKQHEKTKIINKLNYVPLDTSTMSFSQPPELCTIRYEYNVFQSASPGLPLQDIHVQHLFNSCPHRHGSGRLQPV